MKDYEAGEVVSGHHGLMGTVKRGKNFECELVIEERVRSGGQFGGTLQDDAVMQQCLKHCLPWSRAKELQLTELSPKTGSQLGA